MDPSVFDDKEEQSDNGYVSDTGRKIEKELQQDSLVRRSGFGLFRPRGPVRQGKHKPVHIAFHDTGFQDESGGGIRQFTSRIIRLMGLAGIPGVPVVTSAALGTDSKKPAPDKKVKAVKKDPVAGPEMYRSDTADLKPSHKLPETDTRAFRSVSVLGAGANTDKKVEVYAEERLRNAEESFVSQYEELLQSNRKPYAEFAALLLLVLILASGVLLLKPSLNRDKSIENKPFEFTDPRESPSEPALIPSEFFDPTGTEESSTTVVREAPADIALSEDTSGSNFVLQTGSELKGREVYVVQKGDTIWAIAKARYKDPWLWPAIYSANREQLTHPDRIDTTQELVIPEMPGTSATLLEADRKLLAKGYFQAYKAYSASGYADAEQYYRAAERFGYSMQ